MNEAQPFTSADDAKLRELHATGIPFSAIAAAMNRSKNSIVGRVHRLKLPPRPSPIKGGPQGKRLKMPTGGGNKAGNHAKAIRGSTLAALGVVQEAPAPAAPALTFQRASQPCCWPIGEPKTRGFRYCDAPGVPGRSYCAEHEAKAWRRERTEAERARDETPWLERQQLVAKVARLHARGKPRTAFAGSINLQAGRIFAITRDIPD